MLMFLLSDKDQPLIQSALAHRPAKVDMITEKHNNTVHFCFGYKQHTCE